MAKGLKKNATKLIGILVEDVRNFASPYIIDGICQQCEAEGYHINLNNLQVNRKVDYNFDDIYTHLAQTSEFQAIIRVALKTLLSARISGLIYVGTHPRDVSNLLPKVDIPVVYSCCYAEKPASSQAQSINYDDCQGARLAVKSIIEAGHKKIAVMGGVVNSYATHRRMAGYKDALSEHSLPIRTEYIVWGNWSHESGYKQAEKLFDLPDPPTAVFAMNDLMAFGVIDTLKARGVHVPKDVSVHGFDDLLAARFFSPRLSTITLPLHEIGMKSAESVIRMAKNNGELLMESHVLIPCFHVGRESIKRHGPVI
jgi:LacI family transcriptional regulator